jgi:hypothetical protein
MTKIVVFIQAHGRPGILDTELSPSCTLGELREALAAAGVHVDEETFVFLDDAEEHLCGEIDEVIRELKHGSRIHVCRCKRIKTTVNYLEKSAEHEFAPGVRVRAVKEWAVHKFGLDPKDAAEHVLQLCGSKERPSTDTPLNHLVGGAHEHHGCGVCFDLVPDKRVEG